MGLARGFMKDGDLCHNYVPKEMPLLPHPHSILKEAFKGTYLLQSSQKNVTIILLLFLTIILL